MFDSLVNSLKTNAYADNGSRGHRPRTTRTINGFSGEHLDPVRSRTGSSRENFNRHGFTVNRVEAEADAPAVLRPQSIAGSSIFTSAWKTGILTQKPEKQESGPV